MLKFYLREIASGDRSRSEKGLEGIYVNYGKLILNNANRVLRDSFQAEEILNDVLFFVWNNASRLKKLSNPLGYILTISFNRAIDLKRKKREIPSEFELSDEKTEREFIVDELLTQMEPLERMVLLLRDGYGYSFVQIAKAVGLTYKQVRNRYEKAFLKFKKLYETREK